MSGGTRAEVLERVGAALSTIPPRWRERGDLSLLAAAADPTGISLAGCGFAQVLVDTAGGWLAAALPGSPLLGEPGLPGAWPVPQPPLRAGARFLGLCAGQTVPTGDVARACGVRA